MAELDVVSKLSRSKIPICITVDKQIRELFKQYCKDNGMKMSTKINNMMKDSFKKG